MKIFQRIFAFAVITALVMTLIPLTVFADNEFVNSDVEFTSGDRTYIVNDEGRVYSETLPGVDVVFLTDYKADTLAVYNDSLFLSAGSELRRIDLSGGTDSFVWKSQSKIGYFSVCGGAAYALSDGTIMKINISSGKSSVYFSGYDIKKFSFSQADTLEFMVDDEHIYTLNVKEGELTEDINPVSCLGEDIPTVSPKDIDGYIETQATILSLQSKFPAGKYWNHANNPGSSNNNQNGYTSVPCPDHNGTIGTASQTCNGFAPNGSQLSWQCMGYAEKCGYDVTGYNPRNTGYGWVKSSDSSRVDTIKAGDIVRYRNGGHSIYITGVSGSTITFTDCNSDGACIIRWGRTIEKSTLKSTFTYIRIAPYEGDSVFGPGTSVNASVHLDANGGSVSVNVVRIKSGNTYGDLPVPVREGYGFDGWFTSATGGTMIDSQTKVSGDIYLYAHWTKNKYTVTYDATGGINAPAVQVKEFGEKVTISAARPERDGYRFINWNSKMDGSGKIYTGSSTYSDDASIVLYAQWDANAYKLRFDANGGYCSSDGITIDFGQPFGDLPVPSNPGYDFEGWYTLKEGGELVQPDHTFPTANNLIVYAHWVPIVYQVDYDGNGYDGEGALPETQYKKFNESIILRMNSPQMAGGKFIEWNTEPDGSGTTYTDGARYGANENLTLFAVWDRVKYTVTFDANSGTGAPQAIVKEHGLDTVLPETIPTRYGYSFEYWNTRPDGMGAPYYPGGTYNENGDKTLYAIWVAGPFTVRYNGCGGSISASSMNYVFDSPYGTMPTAEKVGYDFLGWFSEENGGEIVNSQDKVGKYSILYAHWKAKTYVLNFDANGGSISQASKTVTYDSEIGELPVPVKQGYIFSGWFNEKGRQFKPESIVKFNADQNLTARWAPSHYVVYFDSAGGSCDRAYMSVQSDSAYGSLPVPSREGFRFTGWYDGETAVTESRIFTSAKNLTLKAKWEFTGTAASSEKSYIVTFVSGDESQSFTVKCGDEIQLPVPAEREGKTFIGWYPEVPYTVVDEDLTFTAAYINDVWFAEFIADGTVAAAEEYTVNTLSVSEPSVPEKPGYYGNWDAYSLVPGGTVVFADYTPVIYTATFVTGGEVIATVTYTVEDEGIEEPQVPYRSGYTGRWAEYTLIPGGITVVAVYDLDVGGITISIGDPVSSKPFEADYRSAVRIIPRVSKSISVTEIRWYIDGEYDSTGGEYYVKDVRKGFKVRADLCYKDKVIATSGEKQIKINSGFIQRVIAFFKALFGNLPTKTIS